MPAGRLLRRRLRALAAGLAGTSAAGGVHVRRARSRHGLARRGHALHRPGAQWTDRRWHTVAIALPATAEPALDVQVSLSTRVAPGATLEPCLGALRRASLRVAARAATKSADRSRHSRGVFAPMASATRSSCCARRASPRMTPRHTPAGSRATRQTSTRSRGWRATSPRCRCSRSISIVTPVYNTDPRWLRACIDSVRRQVYPNWELCLCDDASSTPETIRDAARVRGRSRGSASATCPSTPASRRRRTRRWRWPAASSSRCSIMTTS